MLGHDDSVVREHNVVKINTTVDGLKLDSTSTDVVTVLLGIYSWYESPPGYSPSGWNITFSGNSWTARYSKGGSSPPGTMMYYENIAIKIPMGDLFISPEAKLAAAAFKAKQEADAKAAADLKAKQEADAKAAADLKAKQEADAKAAADLKAKQEADAKAAAEKILSDAAAEAARILAEARAATKKTTITCVKGKLTKKVTAVKPKCPSGYKKK
jgi:hypothetical protein